MVCTDFFLVYKEYSLHNHMKLKVKVKYRGEALLSVCTAYVSKYKYNTKND